MFDHLHAARPRPPWRPAALLLAAVLGTGLVGGLFAGAAWALALLGFGPEAPVEVWYTPFDDGRRLEDLPPDPPAAAGAEPGGGPPP